MGGLVTHGVRLTLAIGLVVWIGHSQAEHSELKPRLDVRSSRRVSASRLEGNLKKAMSAIPNTNMAAYSKKKKVIHVWHYHYKFKWQGLRGYQVKAIARRKFLQIAGPKAQHKFNRNRHTAIRRLDTPNMVRRSNNEIKRGQNEQNRQQVKLGVMTRYRQNERAMVNRDLETLQIKLDKKQASFVAYMNKRVDLLLKEMNRMVELIHGRLLEHQSTMKKHFQRISVDISGHGIKHQTREYELEKIQKAFIRTLILVRSEAYIAEHWMYVRKRQIVKKYLAILKEQAKKGQIITRANLAVERKAAALDNQVQSAMSTQKQQADTVDQLRKALHKIRTAIGTEHLSLQKFAGKLTRRNLSNEGQETDLKHMEGKLDELEEVAKNLGTDLSGEERATHTQLHMLVEEVQDFVSTLKNSG